MTIMEWLLDADPAIRWQVLRDLANAPTEEVASERARVAHEGWGAQLLAAQGADGYWGVGAANPEWVTLQTLLLLRDMGLDRLSSALAPLTSEQLALRAAPQLRSIEALACHIIGVRAGWFHNILGEGDDAFGAYHEWDHPDAPTRAASELVEGFAATWQTMQAALAGFTSEDLTATLTGVRKGYPYAHQRGWVIWHVLEHDLHHGGEIGFSLGMHGLLAPDL